METLDHIVEGAGRLIEVLAAAIIIAASLMAVVRFLIHHRDLAGEEVERSKVRLGRALLLSLELMVGADIIETMVLTPTPASVATLGLLILIRTFLSWALTIETEGQWPWNVARANRALKEQTQSTA